MITATYEDKDHIVDILTGSFDDNKSVNYIIRQDRSRARRIRGLMNYSFEICYHFGKVYLSDDKKACALIVFPDKKKITFKAVLLDLKFVLCGIGLVNVKKAIVREVAIKKMHPKIPMCYLWFIAVHPRERGNGIGTLLLEQIINLAVVQNRVLCLETSTQKNIPWYQNFGFTIYGQLDFGYTLFLLKRVAD